jgi:hypothetical protein
MSFQNAFLKRLRYAQHTEMILFKNVFSEVLYFPKLFLTGLRYFWMIKIVMLQKV